MNTERDAAKLKGCSFQECWVVPSSSCALIGIIQVELRIDHTVIKKHSDRVAEIINLVSPGHFCSRAAIACHHGRRQLRGISVTRSLRASKPISSFPEFEGSLALTRLLTRRLHVRNLSVCRHCVAHLASLFVVKPHGPGRLKTRSQLAPGIHRSAPRPFNQLSTIHSTISLS